MRKRMTGRHIEDAGKVEDAIIIGAGPAGLTAALQLKRYGIDPLVFERSHIGGLLRNANSVENYPGFPGGIPGSELVRLFEDQASQAGVHVVLEEVIELTHGGDTFRVVTPEQTYLSRIVIIASGTKPKTFADPAIPESLRDRIFYEVYPLHGITGKRIIIVGAGDAAFDYALNLGNQNDVIILNRDDRPSCLPLLQKRASLASRIKHYAKTRISKIASDSHGKIVLECIAPTGSTVIHADHLILAIGREPQIDFTSSLPSEQIARLEADSLLYFIGDVKNGIFRQTAIAAGDGLLAAMKICQRFQNLQSGKTAPYLNATSAEQDIPKEANI